MSRETVTLYKISSGGCSVSSKINYDQQFSVGIYCLPEINFRVQVVESKTQLIRCWSILLLRQHVSALALGHHQVSNCVLKETIQRSIYIAHNIQRDLVDSVTIDNFQIIVPYCT
jgi:hypothetical protein